MATASATPSRSSATVSMMIRAPGSADSSRMNGLDAAQTGHAYVHQNQVRAVGAPAAENFLTVGRGRHALDAGHGRNRAAQRLSGKRGVVADEDGCHGRPPQLMRVTLSLQAEYMWSPVRLTPSDMCPIASSFNRLDHSTTVTRKSYGSGIAFGTLREEAHTEQSLAGHPSITLSYAPFSSISSLLLVSVATFAMSHIYIYLHRRCTVVSTVRSARRARTRRPGAHLTP